MNILGISAFYHDSAAALIVEGDIVAAAQEERFTRKKHDPDFPKRAMAYCLEEGGITAADLDYVVFYEKPLLKFDRLLETYVAFAPRGFGSFMHAIPQWLKQKLHLPREIRRHLGDTFKGHLVFTQHHESHAASAFFPSPYESAAILTIDGVGEWATASIGRGEGRRVELLKEMHFPHSLGLLYSAFTYHCGFRVNSGEYKLMGLAPYGRPEYRDRILEHLLKVMDDGSIWLDMKYFNYCHGLTMTSPAFDRLFDGPARAAEGTLEQKHMDMAASVQAVTEMVMTRMCRHAQEITGEKNLCLAGGVALNCVANGKILAEGEFDAIWIQPAAGDAGGALGAALFVWYHLLDNRRIPLPGDLQKGTLLGPKFGRGEILAFLEESGAVYSECPDEASLINTVVDLMTAGKIVGWFQGRMEFGPRALGSRSILGDARDPEMQSVMNRKIKYRESFRPFAPCVLAEDVEKYFTLATESPYMLLVADVQTGRRRELTDDERKRMTDPDLRARVNIERSDIPAVTHVDYSARVQTVDEERHGRYYRLMRKYKEKTGCSVIINTSFNVRGEPIVGTPANAHTCFMNTEMDVLVLENFVLLKEQQPARAEDEKLTYREGFALD